LWTAYGLALLLPNLLLMISAPTGGSVLKLLGAGVILLVLHSWTRRLRLLVLLSLPWFLLLPLDAYYTATYGQPPDASLLVVLIQTTPDEAADYLRGRELRLIAAFAISLGLWLLALRRAGHRRLRTPPAMIGLSRGLMGLMVLVPAVAALPAFSGLEHYLGSSGDDSAIDRDGLPWGIDRLRHIYPYGRMISGVEFAIGQRNVEAMHQALQDFRFKAHRDLPASAIMQREVHVFVVGESSRRDRWGLLGYARDTTPELSALESTGTVIGLGNAISSWSITHASVPTLLSRKSDLDHRRIFPERSLISLYHEAGFRTYWISNQARPFGAGNTLTHMADEADESIWTTVNGNYSHGQQTHDGALIEPLQAVLARGEPQVFIVLHMIGSHDAYQTRYPTAFNRFHPSMEDLGLTDHHAVANREAVNNSYDNSIAHTDHVLAETVRRIGAAAPLATLYFVSDHGENLFDGDCDRSGHGDSTRWNFEIASFIWTSPGWQKLFAGRLTQLRAHRNEPIGSNNVFHTAAGLAGIRFDKARPDLDLGSTEFRSSARHINTPQAMDFDQAIFAGTCLWGRKGPSDRSATVRGHAKIGA
jgi:glucan phosphoethanolaminetransferase (alkaline phosphatase superfamily)